MTQLAAKERSDDRTHEEFVRALERLELLVGPEDLATDEDLLLRHRGCEVPVKEG